METTGYEMKFKMQVLLPEGSLQEIDFQIEAFAQHACTRQVIPKQSCEMVDTESCSFVVDTGIIGEGEVVLEVHLFVPEGEGVRELVRTVYTGEVTKMNRHELRRF